MSDPLFSVADQVVFVSGGSRGIGQALARGFAERNARVVITGRQPESLAEAARELSLGKHPVMPVACDVSDPEQIVAAVDRVVREQGRIDTLVNVAGVNKRQRAEKYSVEEFDFILDINLKGAFFVAQTIGRQMLAQRAGCQIHVDSLNTHAPLRGVVPYAMSKFGVVGMTRGLAAEWGEFGIRVNSIAPGFILTDLTRKLWSNPTMHDWGKRNTPLGRLGEVDDLIGAALFLASPAAAFMTGQVVRVDGGFSAGLMWPIEL